MSDKRQQAERTIKKFLDRAKKRPSSIELDTELYGEGIGLDSLETAELSAVLEDELGSDPFTNGQIPQTVGDIVDFYDGSKLDS